MEAVRAEISSWTASFRYAGFMIGRQPTLPLPPPSTVYGLLSATAGRIITPHDTFLAYTFTSRGRATDLERILEVEPGKGGKWNVIRREMLFDCHLTLYVDTEMEQHLRRPHFPLLLGRSTDLATVDSVERVDLEQVTDKEENLFGRGLYVSPPTGYRWAFMYALPLYFTEEIPRRAVGTRPFYLITDTYRARGEGVVDPDRGIVMQMFDPQTMGLT